MRVPKADDFMGVDVPSEGVQMNRPSFQFWLLAALLVVIFLTGGSQRVDVASLQILRPVAMLVAAYALFTMKREQWRRNRHLLFLLTAVVALVVVHLVPLSPGIWRQLPGREIIDAIDAVAGIANEWRPLSMVPSATWNALYSLAVPIAVFCLAVQLELRDHVRLLSLIIVLTIISGAVGLLQVIGVNIAFYGEASDAGGLFANRNHQGVLLALLFPMLAVAATLVGTIGMEQRLGMIVAGALAVVAIPLIIITGSRAGLVAALIGMALIPFLGLNRMRDRRRRRAWWPLAGKFAAGIALMGFLGWLTVFASRGTAISRLTASEEEIRYPVWTSIVEMLHVYMPWGSGIGTYADVYSIIEPEILLRPTFSNHAHNELLEVALTAGVPGLFLMAWALVLFLYAGWCAFRAEGRNAIVSRLGLGVIVVLSFASTLDYPVRTPIMASVLAIAAVWASSFGRFEIDNGRR